MSNAVFPRWPGQAFSVLKRPMWKTLTEESTSGKELRLALWTNPTWEFTLKFDFLLGNQAYNSMGLVPSPSALMQVSPSLIANDYFGMAGFFMGRQGSFDSWLFDDPTDNTIAQTQIATGDGVTTAFQIGRQLGEYLEPIQNLNGTPLCAATWAASTNIAVNAPILPTPSTMRLQAGRIRQPYQSPGWPNYFLCTTAGTTGLSEPAWRNAPLIGMTISDGAVVWQNAGTPTVLYLEQALANWIASHAYSVNASILPLTNNAGGFTHICTTAGTSGASAPSWNQNVGGLTTDGGAGWINVGVSAAGVLNPSVPQLPSAYALSTGIATFTSAPPNGSAIFATSGFYYRCRFKDDVAEFEEFMHRFYRLGKLDFVSVKS